MVKAGRPLTRPYLLMLDLLYSQSDTIERTTPSQVFVRTNQYIAETGVESKGILLDYLEHLVERGYVRSYKPNYAVIVVEVELPLYLKQEGEV